jgi:hypothetical protein
VARAVYDGRFKGPQGKKNPRIIKCYKLYEVLAKHTHTH